MLIPFEIWQWLLAILCAVVIGFAKTGVQGTGVLIMPLAALILPARASTGFVLPMLCLADIMAIVYWRRHVEWKQLARLLPWTIVGIILGFFGLGRISNDQLMIALGIIILTLLGLNALMDRYPAFSRSIPHSPWFSATLGTLTGTVSMLSNIAGPLATIYLLALGLDKKRFISTNAWLFWIINLIKLPFSGRLGLIDGQSLLTNLALLPALIVGGALGILLIHRIPQKAFNRLVWFLALAAGIYLCIAPLLP